jgi:hypothetical protein
MHNLLDRIELNLKNAISNFQGVVNPMVREWTDMGDSDDLTLINSDYHYELDPRTPTPPESSTLQ